MPKYKPMKSIEQRRKEAYERQLARKSRTPKQQLDLLKDRGAFGCREYTDLHALVCKAK